MASGPKFSCPECGKNYPWNPELAGKKARCKCGAVMHVPTSSEGVARLTGTKLAVAAGSKSGSLGGSSIMSGSSHFSSRPRPTPKPVAVGDPGDSYGGNGSAGEEVVVPPPYAATATATATATASAAIEAGIPSRAGPTSAPSAKRSPMLKWLGIGALAAWAAARRRR